MTNIEVRRVRSADRDELAAFYAGLSPEARRARFLGYTSGLTREVAHTFCAPDHLHEEGFVAVARGPSDPGLIVGHLCLVASGQDSAELGVAVADGYRGQGIGRRLFEAALAWARENGCARITATAFADNHRVLRLLTSAPYPAVVRPADGGIVDVIIPLSAPVVGAAGASELSRAAA